MLKRAPARPIVVPPAVFFSTILPTPAGGAGSSLGTGGMSTKINAAKIAVEAGIDMIIMNGKNPDDLYDLFENKEIGTIFKSE